MQKASRRRARLRSRIGGSAASSLLDRASDRRPATYKDRRLAEEIREAAGDLVNRIRLQGVDGLAPTVQTVSAAHSSRDPR